MQKPWKIREYVRHVRHRRAVRLAHAAVVNFPTIARKLPHNLPSELIVSLTSYPPRFATLAATLRSLLDQKVAADRTILWVSAADRAELPKDVVDLERFGLEIRDCEDLRSYKKIIPAMQMSPEATIVTADDDIYYMPDWLGQLVGGAIENPSDVIAQRAHLALLDNDGHFRPYSEWVFDIDVGTDRPPDAYVFPTGVGGVLYPPHSLDPRVVEIATFQRLCPTTDDIWLFWMARLAGSRQRKLVNRFRQIAWEGTQDVALMHINLGGGNDSQTKAMEQYFGTLPRMAGSNEHPI